METSISNFTKHTLSERLTQCLTVTKNLAFQKVSKGSNHLKLVISTKLLGEHGWFEGTRNTETVIGHGKGMLITKASIGQFKGTKKICSRTYKGSGRKEELLDIRSQEKIQKAFCGASRAHIVISKESIKITPIFDATTFKSNAGNITIPDVTFQRDSIISVLDTIEAFKLTHINFKADYQFWGSHDALLLKTQLRRLGYVLHEDSNGNIVAQSNNAIPPIYNDVDVVECTPLAKPDYNEPSNLETFVGFSAGFDAHLLEKDGFKVTSALEWAPVEKRDTRDKTEDYALTLLANTSVKHLFNENIYFANTNFIAGLTENIPHAHFSLSCVDFSPLKTNAAKEKAFDELTTSRDMFIPTLKLVTSMKPLTISIENVPSFINSPEYEILTARLNRLGYATKSFILYAPDHGGLTSRKRLYMFASRLDLDLDQLQSPSQKTSQKNAWDAIAFDFDSMRDVTHTSSVQKGITTKRLRPLKEGVTIAPTIFKAQNRQLKDTLYCQKDGRYFLPTVKQLRKLAGMPESFKMDFLSIEQQTAVIGQGVDAEMHKAWSKSIKDYLQRAAETAKQYLKHEQLELFC